MTDQLSRLVIVTVVREDLEGFERTCNSLVQQNQAVEHLVIDGASGPQMQESLARWSAILGSTIVSEPDHGTYDAMNKALLRLGLRDRVWFLNAGDTLCDADAYAYADAVTCTDDFTWGYGPARVIETDGRLREIQIQAPYSVLNHAYGHTPICHQAAIVRVEALRAVGGFDLHYPIVADYKSLLLLGQECEPISWTRALIDYRAGGISDRHLLRSHWQQHEIRLEVIDSGIGGRSRSAAYLAKMGIRITTGRAIDRLTKFRLVDRDWRATRSSGRRVKQSSRERHDE